MKTAILTASLIVASLTACVSSASSNEVVKFNTASCNYAPASVKVDKDGRQNYKIVCVRETKTGYNVTAYGIGKDQTTKVTASGKNTLIYNSKTNSLMDGKKVVFSYKGTYIRSAVVTQSTKTDLFTVKNPSLAQFNTFFDKYQICAY